MARARARGAVLRSRPYRSRVGLLLRVDIGVPVVHVWILARRHVGTVALDWRRARVDDTERCEWRRPRIHERIEQVVLALQGRW
jgi:hypothetical protein